MDGQWESIDVRPIVRGVMVPCSWSKAGVKDVVLDTALALSTTFLQPVDISTAKRIRRDGLVFANTDRGIAEGIIHYSVIPELEARVCGKSGTEHEQGSIQNSV